MSIPFDLVKKMILDIARGVTLTEAAEATGYSMEAIEKFFHEEVGYSYHEYEGAEGIMATTMAPYYDAVAPVALNYDMRRVICNEIDSYGQVLKDAEVVQNLEGIWINDSKMNVVAYHTYDNANQLGVIHYAVNGFYPDGSGILHELDVYGQIRLTEENFVDLVGDNVLAVTSDEHTNAFKVIFKAIHNDYRV